MSRGYIKMSNSSISIYTNSYGYKFYRFSIGLVISLDTFNNFNNYWCDDTNAEYLYFRITRSNLCEFIHIKD